MTELKPCPFCGGEAIRTSYKTRDMDKPLVAVECIKCEAKTNEFYHHADAKKAWNKRTPTFSENCELSGKGHGYSLSTSTCVYCGHHNPTVSTPETTP